MCVKNNEQNMEILRKNNLCASYEVRCEVIIKATGPITKYNIGSKNGTMENFAERKIYMR